ncbi:MAG: trypsin-like peptidase domain-containing protein [Chloroflexi bacterium]|nr:trypsin-like peptidase domain-containing protein [Chloroflexota bacterium]
MSAIKIRRLLVCLPLTLSLVLSGCSFFPNVVAPPSPTPAPPQTTAPPNPQWTISPAAGTGVPLPDFVSVVAKIKPSVVAINTEVTAVDIFNRPFTQEAAGSGWIIDKAGYVVTNNHVVEGATNITVTLDDGRTFPAKVAGTDSLADIAVIKIEAENLVQAKVGDSAALKVGEWVLAIGNSLNLGVTPSEGIVRSLGASVPVSGQTLYGLIGTSAPINPGNSGGPLVNMHGEVVGITTVKILAAGVEAMGWAISTETALPIIKGLIQKGYITRPWLGVELYTVDAFVVLRYNLAVDKGALVTGVAPGSPADKAGLKAGDVITGMSGKEMADAQDLVQAIHASNVGQEVELAFWRGQTKGIARATLIESPPPS